MRIRTGNFDAPHPVHSAVHSLIALLGLGPKDVITLKSLMEREREATTTTPLVKEFAARVHTEITGLHDRYHLSYDDPISREQSE